MSKSRKKSKQDRLHNNLAKVVKEYMGGRGFVPITEEELRAKLSLPEEHAETLHQLLKSLVKEGEISLNGNRYLWKGVSKDELLIGTIRVHPRGFGFVQPAAGSVIAEDIFVPKQLTRNAVDGDTVEVQINPIVSDKGPEGRVVAIIKRGRTHVAGIVKKKEGLEWVVHVPLLGSAQHVVVEGEGLTVGDRIIMEVVDWGSSNSDTHCRLSHKIGHISDPSCDITAAIEEFDLQGDFPSEVVREANSFGATVEQEELRNREDLRSLACMTIDPDTAKDFDDALSLTVDEKGHYYLGVHIADVSHYVRSGTQLDDEARRRANSTYFPGFCLPMLPPALSDNLCSLKPNVNRLAISTLMEFDGEGELITYRIVRSVIKSKKRFTYREAFAILEGKKKSPHKETLEQMVSLCRLLKEKRCSRGSIDLAMPELVVLVDEKGMPTHTDLVEYDITHQLVEEFMLKNNELIALHLDTLKKNLAYRVHDSPSAENIKDFVLLARACGFDLPDAPDHNDLQELFNSAGTTPFGQHLSTSYIRRMRMAFYSPDNIGHYGLSLTHYCHFTSPIRRYADLIVHRILFGDSDDYETLDAITAHCSEQERLSARAENHVRLLKKLRLLTSLEEAEPHRQHEAIVTEVKPFGIVVEIVDLMLDAFVHVSEIGDDYFHFEERKMRLVGSETGLVLALGDQVTALVKEIDLITLESRWELILEEKVSFRPKREKKGKKRGRRR